MKKLSLILLVIGFALGFAGQVRAEFTTNLDKDAFAGDEEIFFDELAGDIDCSSGMYVPIADQYKEQYGVRFSGVLFAEKIYNAYFMSNPYGALQPVAASNFNSCTLVEEMDIEGEPITVFFDPAVTRVGFNGFSYEGEITVTAFRGGVAMGSVTQNAFPETFIGIEDTEGIDAIQIEATGYLYSKWNVFFIDNLAFGGTLDTGPTEVEVTMNVNPPSCSGASINVKSKGVTPVVIAGSEDFDVTMIDPASIQLHGVAPVRSAIEDVPYCNNSGSDGYWDLTLKFDTKELVDAMEASALAQGVTMANDDLPVLHLTGSLFDGTTIYADEPVSVRGKPVKENTVRGKRRSFDAHSGHNRGHHKGWDHNRGHHKGWDKNR